MQPTLNHFLQALALSSIINQMLTSVAGIRNSAATTIDGRRILHEPLFPIETIPPPSPVEPPPPPASPESDWPFFPQGPPVPILDQPRSPAAPTNLTSPTQSAAPPAHPIKRITIVVSVSIAALGMLSALAVFLYCHRVRHPTAESDKLVGNDAQRVPPDGSATSDGLYLGTMDPYNQRAGAAEPNRSPYHRLNSVRRSELHQPSPELQPLPPLTGPPKRVSPPAMSSDEDTLFYSPQGSIAETSESSGSSISRQILPPTAATAATRVVYTSNSTQSHRASPKTRLSNCSSDIKKTITTSAPPPPPPPPPLPMPPCIQQSQLQCAQPKTPSPPKRKTKFASPPSPPPNMQLPPSKKNPPTKAEGSSGPPPPPPPPPLPMLGKTQIPEAPVPPMPVRPLSKPQYVMPAPTAAPRAKAPPPVVEANRGGSSSSEPHEVVDNMDNGKPRLKPLHWDKVRASSDRATVWDQLKSSSFQLNEDMIESLFCNSAIPVQKEATRRPVLLPVEQGNRVLDPKKSQNIAILLRALNVTREEVCEALLDGNQEGLGPELLETLVKMAPTKEEELKLRDYSGDLSKLGSAEHFLKAVLDIPFAFKRVDAMLYRANFDAEVKYLRKTFETLEAACEELKNSRLFFKLLEAVLRTGNRMNVGTNRGEAKAFKLDTLLKLVDVKGTDGKTTLLHFVVQEIIRSEGSGSDHPPEDFLKKLHPKSKEEEFKKQGLRVVAGLSNELSNVKKAAGMDSDVLSSYVTKLERELEKIKLVLQLEKSCTKGVKFFEAMKSFLREAEDEILRVKAEEKTALAMVKEVTEYFHGDTAKEEAHPFRIFMVVRDFLLVLDQVCKEVGTMQDRVVVGSARSFRISANASLPVFNRFNNRKEGSSDDDSSLSS